MDDGERTPEMNAESARGMKRPRRGKSVPKESEAQRGPAGHLGVDWEGDMRMRSPGP